MKARVLLALYASACGRVDFDARDDASLTVNGDTSLPDTPSDAFAPLCTASHLLCDLAEADVDAAVWNDVGGTVVRDTTIAHRGVSSFRMTIPGTQANTQVGSYIAHVGPAISSASELWIRAWLRMNAVPSATNAAELVTLEQSSGLGVYIFSRSDAMQLYHQFDTANGETTTTPPLNTWFCLVWHITLRTTSTGSSDVTSDILPPFSITSSITQGAPAMDTIAFGPFFAANNIDVAQVGFDVWVDDILVDDAPVTCAD